MYSISITGETYEELRQKVADIALVFARFATVDEARMTPTTEAAAKSRLPRPLQPAAEPAAEPISDMQRGVPSDTPTATEAAIVNTPMGPKADKASKAPKAPKAEKAATQPRSLVDEIDLKDATLATLKEAFANGKRAAVMTLLARHGNGAKTFRELPDEAFPLIRKEIEQGALA